jgi:Zn-dependent protease
VVAVAIVVALAVIVAVHEAGHAAAALTLGFDDVRVRWFPPRTSYAGAPQWGRVALVSLAGPAANVVVGLAGWAVAQTASAGQDGVAQWVDVWAFLSVLFGAANLVPVPGSDGWTAAAAMTNAIRR